MKHYSYTESPLGRVLLTSDGDSLTGLYLEGQKYAPQPTSTADDASSPIWVRDDSSPLFAAAIAQLAEYFAGERTSFEVPLAPVGTAFQQQVWQDLQTIPYGSQVSYGSIAHKLGRPQAARAVGAAVGRNPISIIIPCHRVVGSGGALTGFAGGLDRKAALLELEAGER